MSLEEIETTNTLLNQTISRKEKLNELKRKKLNNNESITTTTEEENSNQIKKKEIKFRNYDPINNAPQRDPNNTINTIETVEETVKDLMEKVKKNDLIIQSSELDLNKIQPKKLNWDLKRDLNKKLLKLEPLTQSAIASLIRKRMQDEAGGTHTEEGTAALVKEINTNRILDQSNYSDESDQD